MKKKAGHVINLKTNFHACVVLKLKYRKWHDCVGYGIEQTQTNKLMDIERKTTEWRHLFKTYH